MNLLPQTEIVFRKLHPSQLETNVEIFILGMYNTDRGSINVLSSIIKEFNEKLYTNCQIMYCSILYNPGNLRALIEELDKKIYIINAFKNLYEPFLVSSPHLNHPFIPLKYTPILNELIKLNLLNYSTVNLTLQMLLNNHFNKEVYVQKTISKKDTIIPTLELLKYISSNGILFQSVGSKRAAPSNKSETSDLKELSQMATNTARLIDMHFTMKSGVVILPIAFDYVSIFSSILNDTLSKSTQDYNTKITPLLIYSPYMIDFHNKLKPKIETYIKALTEKIKPINLLKTRKIYLQENRITGEFTSEKFNKLISNSITYINNPRKFTILDWDDNKAKIISEIEGKVLEINNNNALIEANVELLFSAHKYNESLGICILPITYTENFELRKASFQQIPEFTVIQTKIPFTFIVVFPTKCCNVFVKLNEQLAKTSEFQNNELVR